MCTGLLSGAQLMRNGPAIQPSVSAFIGDSLASRASNQPINESTDWDLLGTVVSWFCVWSRACDAFAEDRSDRCPFCNGQLPHHGVQIAPMLVKAGHNHIGIQVHGGGNFKMFDQIIDGGTCNAGRGGAL